MNKDSLLNNGKVSPVTKALRRFNIFLQDETKDIHRDFKLLKFPQQNSQNINKEVLDRSDIKSSGGDMLDDKNGINMTSTNSNVIIFRRL
ncbi:hypothetical protein [Candidatus Paracaedibacter symbiosus]|uniref:hypothetical protein n=1 Tax=Candidatus Paracaedibacter symbiosus TaxID=244582 RepID=UPI000509826D|nr:hypothetical protein [Candidatus Paracaedibacter symbiosus]